jgi:hypothetical protein
MAAPYVVACLTAWLILATLAFLVVWKMGKPNTLKVTAQIAKIFSLSFEATSESQTRMIDDGDIHHDLRLPFADVEHMGGYLA